jgi:hypothetical protein
MEKFQLTFNDSFFKKNDTLVHFKVLPWYLRWLGFKIIYHCKVLENPKQEGDKYTYPIQLIGHNIKWLFIIIYKKEYK